MPAEVPATVGDAPPAGAADTGALHRGQVVAFGGSCCPQRLQKRESMPGGSCGPGVETCAPRSAGRWGLRRGPYGFHTGPE